jgi:hypothetical protein
MRLSRSTDSPMERLRRSALDGWAGPSSVDGYFPVIENNVSKNVRGLNNEATLTASCVNMRSEYFFQKKWLRPCLLPSFFQKTEPYHDAFCKSVRLYCAINGDQSHLFS